jgi:hypothetical protein
LKSIERGDRAAINIKVSLLDFLDSPARHRVCFCQHRYAMTGVAVRSDVPDSDGLLCVFQLKEARSARMRA